MNNTDYENIAPAFETLDEEKSTNKSGYTFVEEEFDTNKTCKLYFGLSIYFSICIISIYKLYSFKFYHKSFQWIPITIFFLILKTSSGVIWVLNN